MKRPFTWTPEANAAFQALKEHLTSAPVLQMPDLVLQFVVKMYASDVGVGAVLSQRAAVDQKLHPCAFFSHLLSLEEWRHWLEGAKRLLLVWTDHKNLECISLAKKLNSRQV